MRNPAKFNGGSEKLLLNQQQQPHFLDSCFLCQKQLAQNSDIFMYRGNTPFCSQECRQEQIDIDDAKEKRWKKNTASSSSSKRASRNSDETRKESSTNKAVRTEAVVVA